MRDPRTAAGAALGLLACGLAVTGPSPAGPALLLGVAAVAAAGGWLSLPLGALALGLVVGQSEVRPPDPALWAGAVVGGLAVGITARRADRVLPWLSGPRALGTGVLLSGLAFVACLLPDEMVRLFTAEGDPLGLTVVTGSPETRALTRTVVPAFVPHPPALAPLLTAVAWTAPLSVWLFLAASATGDERWRRPAWIGGLLVGGLLAVAGVAGLVQLAGGVVALPSADALRVLLSQRIAGAAAVVPVDPPAEGHLTLASRPYVDAVRVVAGALLAVLAFARLRRPEAAATPIPTAADGYLPVALGLAVAAVAVLAPAPAAWSLAAGAILGGGALVGGLFGGAERRLSHDLVLLALMVWAVAAAGPWTGWIPAF